MSAAAERARRYLVEGDPTLGLGVCEAAFADAGGAELLALHLTAARCADELGDVLARVRHLEAAEGAARRAGLDVLGQVLLQLGDAHLRRGEPARAAVTLEEALQALAADAAGRGRAERLLEEARAREGEEEEPAAPPPAPLVATEGDPATPSPAAAERLLAMIDRLLSSDAGMDLGMLLDLVLAELVAATGADRGFVLLEEPGEGLVVRAARDARGFAVLDPARQVSRRVAERAAAESRALRAVRPAEDPRFGGSRSAKALDLQAVVAAPLRYRRVGLGSVVLDRRGSKVEPFDEAAEALVARGARLVGGLIVRTRRREAEQRRHAALLDLFARGADQARQRVGNPQLVGSSEPVFAVLRLIERVGPTEARVLIRGESGTGKELVARSLHAASARRDAPFVPVNCAALSESLLEDELFGHVKGAFSGAESDRAGLFEQAHGGTLFLDEIGDAPPRLQAELLRVLQEGEVRRLGDEAVRHVDVRVIAATHQDLEAMVAEGRFREDLFYRLNVVELRVPALRERAEDVPALVQHFAAEGRALLEDASRAHAIDEATLAELCARPWPGNVRELRNAVLRFVTVGELPKTSVAPPPSAAALLSSPAPVREALGASAPLDELLDLAELERRAVVRALSRAGGVKKDAATLLGVSRRTLYNKLRALGLEE